jgi:hypothetical protein
MDPTGERMQTIVNAIPPFKVLRQRLSVVKARRRLKLSNSYDEILDVIRLLLRGVHVDETWYLSKYPDIADALAAGDVKSARQHFVDLGYFEGRLPCPLDVDEAWYLAQYPDVAEGIARGDIQSARQHFLEYGYEEGRLSSAD